MNSLLILLSVLAGLALGMPGCPPGMTPKIIGRGYTNDFFTVTLENVNGNSMNAFEEEGDGLKVSGGAILRVTPQSSADLYGYCLSTTGATKWLNRMKVDGEWQEKTYPGNEENTICFISSTDPLKENLSDIEVVADAVAEGHDYVELFDMFVEMCIEE